MENYVRIDHRLRQVMIRAQGHWTLEQAETYHADMAEVLRWSMETGQPITIFADLTDLILHTTEVSKRIEDAVILMRRFPIERYALVVPSFLMRMQCRRLLEGIDHSFFDSHAAACVWLGWKGPVRRAA